MFTFGYKTKFSAVLRALAAIAVGLVMIVGNDATATVVKVVAALLFAAGVVTFAYAYKERKSGVMPLMVTNAVVDMGLGLVLFLWPGVVSGLIVFIIGFVLIGFGLLQLLALVGTMSLLGTGFIALILPSLAIVGGILLLLNPFSSKLMTILAGCMLVFYGVSELLSAWQVNKAREVYEIKFTRESQDSGDESGSAGGRLSGLEDVKEAEFRKADD